MQEKYVRPGKYYAICNKMNFDGHYVREFDFPMQDDKEWIVRDGAVTAAEKPNHFITATWYFLNRVNLESCVEAVYPADIFPRKEQ